MREREREREREGERGGEILLTRCESQMLPEVFLASFMK